jgi:predicted transcriptional regulator of viral defense system
MPVFDQILTLAGDQQGLVTVAQVRAQGIDPAQLRLMAHRGRLEHVARGVYRVAAFPIDETLPFAEAAAWAARYRGVVSHEAALVLRNLGDFNPARINITLPPGVRMRAAVPRGVRLHKEHLAPHETDRFEGVNTVTAYKALAQVIAAAADPAVVRRAISDAYRAGDIDNREVNRLRAAVVARTRPKSGVVAS